MSSILGPDGLPLAGIPAGGGVIEVPANLGIKFTVDVPTIVEIPNVGTCRFMPDTWLIVSKEGYGKLIAKAVEIRIQMMMSESAGMPHDRRPT